MARKMKPYYSGTNGKEFWARVKAIKAEGDHDSIYTAGVILQDLEGRVLNMLESAELMQKDYRHAR